jgi:hypothetical protein
MNEVFKCHAEIIQQDDHISIHVIWDSPNVDRPHTFGWGVGLKHTKLAERLKKAVDAGAVCVTPFVKKDIYGKTYVEAKSNVLGRTMNADLKRLGY